MVSGAVLPPATSWGFDLRNDESTGAAAAAQRATTPSTSQLVAPSSSNLHSGGIKRKQHAYSVDDGDSEMDEDSDDGIRQRVMATPSRPQHHHHHSAKRARISHSTSQTLPPQRLLESMDLKGLQLLVTSLCERHPDLVGEVAGMAPRVTVATAIDVLRSKLAAVKHNMPYKSDPTGDYAYLRIKPHLNEFHSALDDYLRHFLPPGESQPSNSLAFLDEATTLVHETPLWSNPINCHQRYAAYDDLAHAWALVIKEAVKRPAGVLALSQGQWEQRIARHNDNAGNRLKVALNTIQQELAWVNGSPSPFSPATRTSSPIHRSATPQLWC
jgi:protein Cut8